MVSSGTYTWDLTVGALMEEAFEMAGIDPEAITHRHITSAMRSLNLLQTELATETPDAQFRVDQETGSLVVGSVASDARLSLAVGTIDVIDIVVKGANDSAEIPILRTNRDDYLRLPDKDTTALRPTQWYVDHSATNSPYIQFWPVPSQIVTVTYDRLRWMQDVDTLSDTFDARRNWLPVMTAGLAQKIAVKFNGERLQYLTGEYQRLKQLAKLEASGRGTVIISTRGFGVTRRRRR